MVWQFDQNAAPKHQNGTVCWPSTEKRSIAWSRTNSSNKAHNWPSRRLTYHKHETIEGFGAADKSSTNSIQHPDLEIDVTDGCLSNGCHSKSYFAEKLEVPYRYDRSCLKHFRKIKGCKNARKATRLAPSKSCKDCYSKRGQYMPFLQDFYKF